MRLRACLASIATACALLAGGPLAAAEIRLDVEGLGDALRDDLRAALLTREVERTEDPSAQDLVAAAQADYRRILTVLYDAGFFGASVSIEVDGTEAAELSPIAAPERVDRVVYRVRAAQRFSFGRAEIGPLAPGTTPPEAFRPGRAARTERIQGAIDAAVADWRAIGHAKARIARERILARHAERRLDVTLDVAPGPRLRFGTLEVTGNADVRTARIRAIAGLPEGAVFDPEEVARATRRLRRTEAFSAVALREAETPGPNGTLDIAATVQEAPRRRIGFGAELNSVEGATVSAYWLHRNLLGGAERLRVEGDVSGIDGGTDGLDYRLRTELRRPATFGSDTDLRATLAFESLGEPNFDSASARAVVGLDRIVSDRLRVFAGAGLRYEDSETVFGSEGHSQVILPLEATYDRRDDPVDPRAGYFLDATALPFAALDDGASGVRLTADARAYRALGFDDRVVLAGRLQLGSVIGPDLRDAVAEDLFFSGGGGTVRGQDYQSLGIDVPALGGTSGGRSFVGLSAELRGRLTERISLVGFYDRGTVGRDALPDADSPSHAGAGLGLRYDTGFGPIRLDVATQADADTAGEDIFFYIGIGQAF